jgi:cell wall-associated NlpC family hydrolase
MENPRIEEKLGRPAIIAEARSWVGTAWHHMGRLKGIGVDCAMLLAEVYERAGVIGRVYVEPYPMQWHLHRDDERLKEIVAGYAHEILRADAKPGDMVLVKYGRAFSHGGIIVDGEGLTIVHAVNGSGVILEDISRVPAIAERNLEFYSCW